MARRVVELLCWDPRLDARASLLDLQAGSQLRQGAFRKGFLDERKYHPLLETDVRLETLSDVVQRLFSNLRLTRLVSVWCGVDWRT